MIDLSTTLSDLHRILSIKQTTIQHIKRFPRGWSVELRSADRGTFEVSEMPTMESALNMCLELVDVAPSRPSIRPNHYLDRLPFPFVESKECSGGITSQEPSKKVPEPKKATTLSVHHLRSPENKRQSVCKAISTDDDARFAIDEKTTTCIRCLSWLKINSHGVT